MNLDEITEVSAIRPITQGKNIFATDNGFLKENQAIKAIMEDFSPFKKPKFGLWNEETAIAFQKYLQQQAQQHDDVPKLPPINSDASLVPAPEMEKVSAENEFPHVGNNDFAPAVDTAFSMGQDMTPSIEIPENGNDNFETIADVLLPAVGEKGPATLNYPHNEDLTEWLETSSVFDPIPTLDSVLGPAPVSTHHNTPICSPNTPSKLQTQSQVDDLMKALATAKGNWERENQAKTTVLAALTPISRPGVEQEDAEYDIEINVSKQDAFSDQDHLNESSTAELKVDDAENNVLTKVVTDGSQDSGSTLKALTKVQTSESEGDTSDEDDDSSDATYHGDLGKPPKNGFRFSPFRWNNDKYKQQLLKEFQKKEFVSSAEFMEAYRRIGRDCLTATVVETKEFNLENIISETQLDNDRQDLFLEIDERKPLPDPEWIRQRVILHQKLYKEGGFKSIQPLLTTKIADLLVPRYRTQTKKTHWTVDEFSIGRPYSYFTENFMSLYWRDGHDVTKDMKHIVPQLSCKMENMWLLDGTTIKYAEPDLSTRLVDEKLYQHIQTELYRHCGKYGADRSEICTHYDEAWTPKLKIEPKKFADKLKAIIEHNHAFNEELRSKPSDNKESSVGDIVLANTRNFSRWGVFHRSRWNNDISNPINIIVNGNDTGNTNEDGHQEPEQGRSCTEADGFGQPISYDGSALKNSTHKVEQLETISEESTYSENHLKHKMHSFQSRLLGNDRFRLIEAVSTLAAQFGIEDTPADTVEMIREMDRIILERSSEEHLDATLYKNMSIEIAPNEFSSHDSEEESPQIVLINALEGHMPMPDYTTGILSNNLDEKRKIRKDKKDHIADIRNQLSIIDLQRPLDQQGKLHWTNDTEKKRYLQVKDNLDKVIEKLTDEIAELDIYIDRGEKMRKIVNPSFAIPPDAFARKDSKLDINVVGHVDGMPKVGSPNGPSFFHTWRALTDYGEAIKLTVSDYKKLLPFLFDITSHLSDFVDSIKHLSLEEMLDQIRQRTGESLPSLDTKLAEYTNFMKDPGETWQTTFLRAQHLATYLSNSTYMTEDMRKLDFLNRMDTLLDRCLTPYPDQQEKMRTYKSQSVFYGRADINAMDYWRQAIQQMSNRPPMRTVVHSLESHMNESAAQLTKPISHGKKSEKPPKDVEDDNDYQEQILSKLNSIALNTSRQNKERGKTFLNKKRAYERDQDERESTQKKVSFEADEPMPMATQPRQQILTPARFNPDEQVNSKTFPQGVLKGSSRRQQSQDPHAMPMTQSQQQFGKQSWPPQRPTQKPFSQRPPQQSFSQDSQQFGRQFSGQYPQQSFKQKFMPNTPKKPNPNKQQFSHQPPPQTDLAQNVDWNPYFVPGNWQRRRYQEPQNTMGFPQTNSRKFTTQGGVCFVCGEPDHWANTCPNRNDQANRGKNNRMRGGFRGGNNFYRNYGNMPPRKNGKIVQATWSSNGDDTTMIKALINQPCQECGPNVDPHSPGNCYKVTNKFRRLEKNFKRNFNRFQNRENQQQQSF